VENEKKKLESQIPEGIEAESDPKYLYEIFTIFMDNAAKYCDDGGTIRAVLEPHGKKGSGHWCPMTTKMGQDRITPISLNGSTGATKATTARKPATALACPWPRKPRDCWAARSRWNIRTELSRLGWFFDFPLHSALFALHLTPVLINGKIIESEMWREYLWL
jgi:hypothetical protein